MVDVNPKTGTAYLNAATVPRVKKGCITPSTDDPSWHGSSLHHFVVVEMVDGAVASAKDVWMEVAPDGEMTVGGAEGGSPVGLSNDSGLRDTNYPSASTVGNHGTAAAEISSSMNGNSGAPILPDGTQDARVEHDGTATSTLTVTQGSEASAGCSSSTPQPDNATAENRLDQQLWQQQQQQWRQQQQWQQQQCSAANRPVRIHSEFEVFRTVPGKTGAVVKMYWNAHTQQWVHVTCNASSHGAALQPSHTRTPAAQHMQKVG